MSAYVAPDSNPAAETAPIGRRCHGGQLSQCELALSRDLTGATLSLSCSSCESASLSCLSATAASTTGESRRPPRRRPRE